MDLYISVLLLELTLACDMALLRFGTGTGEGILSLQLSLKGSACNSCELPKFYSIPHRSITASEDLHNLWRGRKGARVLSIAPQQYCSARSIFSVSILAPVFHFIPLSPACHASARCNSWDFRPPILFSHIFKIKAFNLLPQNNVGCCRVNWWSSSARSAGGWMPQAVLIHIPTIRWQQDTFPCTRASSCTHTLSLSLFAVWRSGCSV